MVSIEGQAEPAATATAAISPTATAERRSERIGAGTAPAEKVISEKDALLARCVARAHYHEERESFLSFVNRSFNFCVVLSGSAAFAAIVSGTGSSWGTAVAFATTTIAALQLVFDFPGKVRTHVDLRRRAVEIFAKASRPEADIEALTGEFALLSAEAPPTFHALEAEAYNHAQLAMGWSEDTLLIIPQWDRSTRNILRHSTARYPIRKDANTRAG